MAGQAVGAHVVSPQRLASYERASHHVAVGEAAVELGRHIRAVAACVTRGDAKLAYGAAYVATATVLRMAATPSLTEREHEIKRGALGTFIASSDRRTRAHVAALVDAALWAETKMRLAAGLRPYGVEIQGHGIEAADPDGAADASGSGPEVDLLDDLARYGAAIAATDVVTFLATAGDVLRDIIALTRAGRPTVGAWAEFDCIALALCVEPAGSLAARLELRRPLLILWRVVRRRRPLTAAVLRQRLALDRARWPGPVRD